MRAASFSFLPDQKQAYTACGDGDQLDTARARSFSLLPDEMMKPSAGTWNGVAVKLGSVARPVKKEAQLKENAEQMVGAQGLPGQTAHAEPRTWEEKKNT